MKGESENHSESTFESQSRVPSDYDRDIRYSCTCVRLVQDAKIAEVLHATPEGSTKKISSDCALATI